MTGSDPTSTPSPPDRAAPPPPPWLAWRPGDRVTVRYRLADGDHEAAGTVVHATLHEIVLDSRRGRVEIPAHTLVIGRRIS